MTRVTAWLVLVLLVSNQAFAQDTTEEALLASYWQALKSDQAIDRLGAVTGLSEASAHGEARSSRAVALAIAAALQDSDDQVAYAAICALEQGRHAAVTVNALAAYLEGDGERIRDLVTSGRGPEVFELLRWPMQNYSRACEGLASYRRPEGVVALAHELRQFEEEIQVRQLFFKCEEALVDALIRHGNQSAIDAVIQHLKSYYLESHRDWLVRIHIKLRTFSDTLGVDPVGFPRNIAQA